MDTQLKKGGWRNSSFLYCPYLPPREDKGGKHRTVGYVRAWHRKILHGTVSHCIVRSGTVWYSVVLIMW